MKEYECFKQKKQILKFNTHLRKVFGIATCPKSGGRTREQEKRWSRGVTEVRRPFVVLI